MLERLFSDVVPRMARNDHPRAFAFVPGCGTWPGALADLIASALNVEASTWLLAAGPIEVELEVLGWFKEWIGYPATASGILTSGGSAANMTALACARERVAGGMSDDLVLYVPDQTHASVARGARILGFRPHQVRVLPTDERFRIRLDALAGAIDRDLGAGRRPLLVCANAGSTSTGSVDPLPELAALCRDRGIWLHVDGAYGAFAVLAERGAQLLAGLELADSVTLDPHKWLFQPFECGCLLVREESALCEAFAISPDYLKDTDSARGQPLRLRPAAEPLVAGAEGVALGPLLRARRLPRRDRPRHRPRAARRAADRVEPRLRAPVPRLARRRLLPPALSGCVRRARAGR